MSSEVAIIIPCYNYGEFLEEAVQSAIKQDIKIELVVVDDGSTDPNTLKVLERVGHLPGVLVYHQLNGGLSNARNNGIANSQAEFIVCLDADDIIQPSYCLTCLKVMHSRPDVGFVYPTTKVFGNENYLWSNKEFSYLCLLVDNYIPCASMFRRKIWEDIGGFPEDMRTGYEDWDFWLSAIENGWRGFHVSQELFWYRKHGKSMLSTSNLQRKELKKFLRKKHGSLYQLNNIIKMISKEPIMLPRMGITLIKEVLYR